MSTLAVAPSLWDRVNGEPTLDDLLAGLWHGLADGRVVSCPVCRGAMGPSRPLAGVAGGGSCATCGTELA